MPIPESEPRMEKPPVDPTKESIDGFACGPNGCCGLQELPPDMLGRTVTAVEEIFAKRGNRPTEVEEIPVDPTPKESIGGFAGGCKLQQVSPDQVRKVMIEVDKILSMRKKGPQKEQN